MSEHIFAACNAQSLSTIMRLYEEKDVELEGSFAASFSENLTTFDGVFNVCSTSPVSSPV